MALSDKVAVLRKGKYIGTVKTSETNPQALTDMMVGHSVTLNIDRPKYDAPVPRLTLKGITCYDGEGVKRLDNVSFTLWAVRSWHRRHRRFRPAGAAGGHCGPASRG